MQRMSSLGRPRRHERHERGAVAIMVALSTVLVAGAAAVSVDLGNARAGHRAMSVASDAGALAGAESGADDADDPCDTAEEVAQQNAPNAEVSCELVGDDDNVVKVTTRQGVEFIFAGVLGEDNRDVSATTYAKFDKLGVGGVRPFGFCVNALWNIPAIQAWDRETVIGPIRMYYGGQAQTWACGGSSGNWGSYDFDGGSNPTSDQIEWITNGYPEEVYIDTWYDGDPGSNTFAGAVVPALTQLMNNGTVFPVALFNDVDGSGDNAELHVAGFANVQLTDFYLSGSQEGRYLEFMFYPPDDDWPGTVCCDPSLLANNTMVATMCGIEEELAGC